MNNQLFSANKIAEAHERIRPFIHRTPILSSVSINEISGTELFFKCENFQKVGAFKMRGAMNAILQLSEAAQNRGVITHSSGNHAQAVAKAAKLIGIEAQIVMPSTAPKVKVAAVEEYGAVVSFCEPTLEARQRKVEELIEKGDYTFVHPYDNLEVILGQATCAKEFIEDQADLTTLICPVGGGGLLAGTALSCKYFGNEISVVAGEPVGADDAFQSFQQKKLIPQTNPTTIADGLLTSLGKLNFPIILDNVSEIIRVDDTDIIASMRLIWERMKIIIEPSCAVPLAAVLKHPEKFANKKVGIILSGGNVDLNHYFDQLKAKNKKIGS
jgi:threonine dehydratase